MKVEFGLADRKMTAGLFCIVFKPMEGDVVPPKGVISPPTAAINTAMFDALRQLMTMVAKSMFERVARLVEAGGDASVDPNTQAKDHEAVGSQGEEVRRVEQLAEEFAARVPELEFSPAEIYSFLLEHRQSAVQAVDDVEEWMTRIREEKLRGEE